MDFLNLLLLISSMKKGVMIRVAADSTVTGGNWHSPITSKGEYVYVPIPDNAARIYPNHQRPYSLLEHELKKFQVQLPEHLYGRMMHLDPDFEHLTYGDRNSKSIQLSKLNEDDIVIFYGAFKDYSSKSNQLYYSMFGLFFIKEIVHTIDVPEKRWQENAHPRRSDAKADEIVIRGKPLISGRLEKNIIIGEYRDRAYRLLPEISSAWGGISTSGDFITRAAVPPRLNDAEKFYEWFKKTKIALLQNNF